MAIAHVQDSALTFDVSGTAAISLSPSAGNALVVHIAQTASATRTYAVSDNIDGATGWAEAVGTNPDNAVAIWVKANVPSGVTTISVAASADTSFAAAASEYSGFGTAITVDDSDLLDEGVAADNHTCSATGVSSANDVVAVCAAVLNSTASECDPGSGYTEVPTGSTNNRILFQRQVFASGATNEVGAWTSTGTNRNGLSVIALLSGNAGGSTNFPLVTDAGSYAVTGTAAALTADRTLSASGGTVAVTGTAAALSIGYVLGVDAGSVVWTGQEATLSVRGVATASLMPVWVPSRPRVAVVRGHARTVAVPSRPRVGVVEGYPRVAWVPQSPRAH